MILIKNTSTIMGIKLYVQKKFFSSSPHYKVNSNDPKYLEMLRRKDINLKREFNMSMDETKELKSDKDIANKYRTALVKKENGQEVNPDELEATFLVRENYPIYFEDEMEESDPEVETSPEYKERKQVAQVIEYLSGELKAGTQKRAALKKAIDELANTIRQAKSNITSGAGSSAPAPAPAPAPVPDPAPAPAPVSSASNMTPSDYIDNLPTEYNPMDDVGAGD